MGWFWNRCDPLAASLTRLWLAVHLFVGPLLPQQALVGEIQVELRQ